ncbi:MAG: hypothetical protein IPQ08_05820 [Chitinophagaceae bacterium]|nr:hypothetical protein [Chitinophagaceae bacterium]
MASVIGNALNAPVLASIAIGLEFAFRLFKTENPKSIVYLIADGIKKSGEVLTKIGSLLDKVLPQRLK